MSQRAIAKWGRDFRAAAKADKHAILRDHLRRLHLPDAPKLLLEGTVQLVRACSLYTDVDHRVDDQLEEFLELQQYNPADASEAQYAYTFDIHEKAYARVLVEPRVQILDLADMFAHTWDDFKVAGYAKFWISPAS